jgi:excisionase family DNA binding protein
MTALLTTRQVADMLGIHPETVLKWARNGDLPAVKLPSGAVRYRPEQLEAWMQERATSRDKERQPPSPDAAHERRVHSISSTAAHEKRSNP